MRTQDDSVSSILRVAEQAPINPSCHNLMFQGAETIHWRVDDLVHSSNDPEKQLRAFRTVRDQIAQRLRLFVIVHVRSQALSQSVSFVSGCGVPMKLGISKMHTLFYK